jgi:hypothetical protein
VFLSAVINAQQSNNTQQALNQTNKSFFIQNKGQWDPEVKYLACIGGMNAWITNSGVVYDYYRIKKNIDEAKTSKMNPREKQDFENKNTTVQGHVVKMQLVNSEMDVVQVGNNQREGYYNYFMSNDKSKWTSYVPLYDNIEIQGIYKNIDVKYYYDNGILRYDYKAKPGADLSKVKFKFDGQEGLSVNAKGELVLKTSIGEVTNGKLYAYQMEGETKIEVPCQFEQRDEGTIGLKATGYNEKKELIIDPLVYSTFIGGKGDDFGSSIAIDANGSAYIEGGTFSSNFPSTPGAYQKTFGGGIFVTKLNSTGSGLIYSTFISGINGNAACPAAITIDASGNVYITGNAYQGFPTTSGAYQTKVGNTGNGNAFVTKLNSTGSALVYSTFIGGNSFDLGTSITVDANNNAYITGNTQSLNYPTTIGAFQTSYGGETDAFVTKLNSTGTALVYSTYIGGSGSEYSQPSIAVDANSNVYITGSTNSSNFPTTKGAFQATMSGGNAVFVTKLNSTGSGLIYSTLIGGNFSDFGNSIAIDLSGNAYITGYAGSFNYPTTSGAYQTTKFSGWFSVFVTKLNSTGSGLVYSTYIGGDFMDQGNSIAVDALGNAYITGYTLSSNYPTTPGAYQNTFGGIADAFITELNPTGNKLVYSTYIGQYDENQGNSIAIDALGNAFITGYTRSSNYPTTSGAYQTTYGGSTSFWGDAFVTKLNIPQNPLIHDVGVLKINGATQFTGGTSYVPSTQIRNYGTVTESFNVICKIYDYKGNILTQSTKTLSNLAADSIQIVNFTSYTLTNNYLYKVEFTTQLTGDLNTDNNTLAEYINTYSTFKETVLLEVITAADQSYCVGNQLGANDLIENGKKVAVIQYHSLLGHDPFTTNEAYNRYIFYLGMFGFIPTTLIDGTLRFIGGNSSNSIYKTYLPLYDSAYSVKTPLKLNITSINEKVVVPYQFNIKIDVHKLAPIINSNTKLFVALTENKIPYSWSGQSEIDYSERLMIPSDGNGVAIDMVTNDSVSVPFTFNIQTSWITTNLELSAWVQDLSTGEIFNTTKIKLADLSAWHDNLIVKDNGNISQSLTFGQSLIATDGVDIGFGEAPLPPAPFGFDARFHLPTGDDSWMDYRSSSNDTINWVIKFQPGSGGYPITFSWDKTALPKGKFTLADAVTGAIVNVDMTASNSYTLTNSGINSLIIQYISASTPTSVKNINTEIPTVFSLMQNYPNPFNPTTVIRYGLPGISNVKLKIYNVLGQEVESLVNGTQQVGFHEVTWNASNKASGIYICSIEAVSADNKGNFRSVKKLLLLK